MNTITKKILVGLVSSLFLLGMTGCKEKPTDILYSKEYTLTINHQQYQFSNETVTQLTHDDDHEARYGVISDIHGEVERITPFVEKLKKRNIEAILVPGDLVKNEELRYGRTDQQNDEQELEAVLTELGKSNLPVFVIPGNHETRDEWKTVMEKIRVDYPNIIDMNQYRRFDGDDADIVSLPGYQIQEVPGRKFIPDNGFWASSAMIDGLAMERQGLDDTMILLTHGPPATGLNPGPGTISTGEDVGEKYTATAMKQDNISFAIVGHIHEAGGYAATLDGKMIREEEWSNGFVANFGTLETWKNNNGMTYNGRVGILTINGTNAKYEMIRENN